MGVMSTGYRPQDHRVRIKEQSCKALESCCFMKVEYGLRPLHLWVEVTLTLGISDKDSSLK